MTSRKGTLEFIVFTLKIDSRVQSVEQALDPPERRQMSRAIRAIEGWKQPALQIEKENDPILLLAVYDLFTKSHTWYPMP